MSDRHISISFLDAFTGLLTEPGATTRELFNHRRPPHILTLFVVILSVLYVPLISYLYKRNLLGLRIEHIAIITLVLISTISIFLILEWVLLKGAGLDLSFPEMVSTIVYSITPLAIVLFIVYLFDYGYHGSLTLAGLFASGLRPQIDAFYSIFPIVLVITQLLVSLNFFYCVYYLGHIHWVNALFLTFVAIAPLYVAFITSLILVDRLHPGASEVFAIVIQPLLPFDVRPLLMQ